MAKKIKGLKGAWDYDAQFACKKVRVTVPENPDPAEVMVDAIKDNLSPQAVATIIAYLQPARVKDAKVQREVEWFGEELVKAVGGSAALNQLMDEVGL
jgi:hypothetical protein